MDLSRIQKFVPADRLLCEEPMSAHTTFRVGGPAELLAKVETDEELIYVVMELRDMGIPFRVIGRGSNLLVSDGGVRGAIVVACNDEVTDLGNGRIRAGAGIQLSELYEAAAALGYTGLEFAAGIPGTLGGGVVMNAGAYGGELKDVVEYVWALNSDTALVKIPADILEFGYRSSLIEPLNLTVLSVELGLEANGDVLESRRRVAELRTQRQNRQPLQYPSAGSTFRRPPGAYAGPLIEACGLKGARIGGAMVSPKHAGFIINADDASASDIYRLIQEVRRVVYSATGIMLEPEVKFIGDYVDD